MQKRLILLLCGLLLGLAAPVFAQRAHFGIGKGSRLHEAVRVPRHLQRLNKLKPKDLALFPIYYGSHPRQYIHVSLPDSGVAIQKQAVFFVHGGGWHVGKPSQHWYLARLLNQYGYVVVLPAYRLTPEVAATEMQADVAQALLFAQELLSKEANMPTEFIMGGASAGANLAALLVYNNDLQAAHGISTDLFAGFFSMAGALDIDFIRPHKILTRYAGRKGSDLFIQSNPTAHISADDKQVPVLCIHGERDGMVSIDAAYSFALELCKYRCDLLEFHRVPKGTHVAVGSQWYYKKKKDVLQSETLIGWLGKVSKG